MTVPKRYLSTVTVRQGKKVIAGVVLAGAGLLTALTSLEKQELVVYADKLAYGVPTVCSGFTDWKLRVGQAYTKEDCEKIDSRTAEEYGLAVLECVKTPMNQNQFDAFTLFFINVGKAGGCKSGAIRAANTGDYAKACRAMVYAPLGSSIDQKCAKSADCMALARTEGPPVWSYAGGKYVRGLHNRRMFEMKLCMTPVPAKPTETAIALASDLSSGKGDM